jgi:hypothetical protein
MASKNVPKGLRIWFLIHFIVDMLIAFPLIFQPQWIGNLMGIPLLEPITARLVGAALIGIGGASLFTHSQEDYNLMLSLKIVWSISAIIGLLLSLASGAPQSIWTLVVLFSIFSSIWLYYKRNFLIKSKLCKDNG